MQKNTFLFLLTFCISLSLSAAQSSTKIVVEKTDTIFTNGVAMSFEIYTETVEEKGQKSTTTQIKKTYQGSKATVVKISKYDHKTGIVGQTLKTEVAYKSGSRRIIEENCESFSPTWVAEHGDEPRTCISPYFFGKEKTD